MKDLTALKTELRWCLEHGNRGPRTEAALIWALETIDEIEAGKADAVLDEIPGSYKSIDEVMANQTDLVEVVHVLKQVLCVKGA